MYSLPRNVGTNIRTFSSFFAHSRALCWIKIVFPVPGAPQNSCFFSPLHIASCSSFKNMNCLARIDGPSSLGRTTAGLSQPLFFFIFFWLCWRKLCLSMVWNTPRSIWAVAHIVALWPTNKEIKLKNFSSCSPRDRSVKFCFHHPSKSSKSLTLPLSSISRWIFLRLM